VEFVTPAPEALEDLLNSASHGDQPDSSGERRRAVHAENAVASRHWGGIQWRIVVTFLVFAVCWVGVIVAAASGMIDLWLGLLLNSVFASTFYMPMHEAVHKNIWGKVNRGRIVEEVIGFLCSIPTGIEYSSHRAGHMRHHAYTNDPDRDPDHFTDGRLTELPIKFYGMTMLYTLLPVFALVPFTRVLLPSSLRKVLARRDGNKNEGKAQIRFWLVTWVVLIVGFSTGHGLQVLMLWWLPARIQLCWLMFIFAWYPHHPARETSRYRHTRVAVFRGSGLLIRGHDYHAVHHLYPRVPHYKLKMLWNELAEDLVPRGVRAEGRALGATQSVVW
jgi:beta-carotene hydroxylase